MQFTVTAAAAAAVALAPVVSAHGYVSSIVAGGKTYIGSNPNWYYQPSGQVVPTAGWFAMNQDNGFVSPNSFGTSDLACHKSAKPGNQVVPVAAGQNITFIWNTWPDTHKGPVTDYIAKCPNNDCTKATAAGLSFVKIDQMGLLNDNPPPGTWATDSLIANKFSWSSKIPSTLAPGQYVIRHEIIALHAAGSANGAQAYPQCINIQVTGSGSATLPAGHTGAGLYGASDPGILIDIYSKISNYIIPGPTSVWAGKRKRDFTA